MKMLKAFAVAGAGAMLGRFVFEKWILKQSDGSGFIEAKDGFGVDDVVGAILAGAGAVVAGKALSKFLS